MYVFLVCNSHALISCGYGRMTELRGSPAEQLLMVYQCHDTD